MRLLPPPASLRRERKGRLVPCPFLKVLSQLAAKNNFHSTPYLCKGSGAFGSRLSPAPFVLRLLPLLHRPPRRAMRLTELNWECLLHVFSFLDKNSRKSLGQTCRRLLWVFQDPSLWPLLHFHSPVELTKDNFVLGAALRHLSICWHSSQVKVCNVEDWMKNELQRSICSLHKHLVDEFLLQVSNRCPSLLSLKLSGCGHVTDDSIVLLLKSCPGLRTLQLENCVLITDQTLEAAALHADSLKTLQVDFCRNITAAGVQRVQKMRPSLTLSAERSANMIPDKRPGGWALERGLKRMLWH